MPLFEFRCPACRNDFESLVRDHKTPACPTCGFSDVEKLFSTAAARVPGHLPIGSACPPPETGPCGPGCCRLPG